MSITELKAELIVLEEQLKDVQIYNKNKKMIQELETKFHYSMFPSSSSYDEDTIDTIYEKKILLNQRIQELETIEIKKQQKLYTILNEKLETILTPKQLDFINQHLDNHLVVKFMNHITKQ